MPSAQGAITALVARRDGGGLAVDAALAEVDVEEVDLVIARGDAASRVEHEAAVEDPAVRCLHADGADEQPDLRARAPAPASRAAPGCSASSMRHGKHLAVAACRGPRSIPASRRSRAPAGGGLADEGASGTPMSRWTSGVAVVWMQAALKLMASP